MLRLAIHLHKNAPTRHASQALRRARDRNVSSYDSRRSAQRPHLLLAPNSLWQSATGSPLHGQAFARTVRGSLHFTQATSSSIYRSHRTLPGAGRQPRHPWRVVHAHSLCLRAQAEHARSPFNFDKAQRLIDNRYLSQVQQSYRYDAHGRRTESAQPNGDKRYQVYSQSGQLIYEALKPAGSPGQTRTTDYLYLSGTLIAKRVIEDIVVIPEKGVRS
jgi:YD repeat-containing protein